MEFRFTEEQRMIRETAEQFFRDASTPADVRRAINMPAGYDPELWRRLCEELGFQAITVPESCGGLGLGFVELAIVLEQMGRQLACSPFLATVGLGLNALLMLGSDDQKQRLLPNIAAGEMTATLAWTGPEAALDGGRWDHSAISVEVTPCTDGYRLNGRVRYVIDGDTADLLIVAARKPGSKGTSGISVFYLTGDASGLTRTWTPTLDQTRRLADIDLQDVFVASDQLLGVEEQAWPELSRALSLGKCALAAEQLGVSRKALELAVEYSLEREQFGRSIASFQAIKHKAADMSLKTEVACSAVYYAACVASEAILDGGDAQIAGELEEAAAMAKGYCSDTVYFNTGSALQVFGGVGFTSEYDIQLYFKRAKASEHYLGNGVWQREQIASLLLDAEGGK